MKKKELERQLSEMRLTLDQLMRGQLEIYREVMRLQSLVSQTGPAEKEEP